MSCFQVWNGTHSLRSGMDLSEMLGGIDRSCVKSRIDLDPGQGQFMGSNVISLVYALASCTVDISSDVD